MDLRSALWASCMLCLCATSSMASAGELVQCQKQLSVTGKPGLAGLKPVKFVTDEKSSSEGGDIQVFSDPSDRLAYVLVTNYGETGKRVALYEVLGGDMHSFSARVSDYGYLQPIDAGSPEVVSVNTTSFIVCGGVVLKGVGGAAIPGDVVQASKDEVAHASRLFFARH